MLRAEGLSLEVGAFRLQEVSFHVPRGRYAAVLGPTGAGKTLLLEAIVGLRRLRDGALFLDGAEITRLPPERRPLGVVYQDYALFPHLTVYGNIAFGLRMRGEKGASIGKAVHRIAEFLEIEPLLERKPAGLSGGERQRVALARALVLDPKMLLLDEPLTSLDPPTRERIRRELKRIHEALGVTIFHITHDTGDAFQLARHLLIMRAGRIVQAGAPEEVLAAPADPFVAELLGVENVLPAELAEDGRLRVKGLGPFRGRALSAGPGSGPAGGAVAIHGWALEPFPAGAEGEYLWRGTLTVVRVLPAGDHVRIELEGRAGLRLRTALSPRERRREGIEAGREIPVGILARGVHWMGK